MCPCCCKHHKNVACDSVCGAVAEKTQKQTVPAKVNGHNGLSARSTARGRICETQCVCVCVCVAVVVGWGGL